MHGVDHGPQRMSVASAAVWTAPEGKGLARAIQPMHPLGWRASSTLESGSIGLLTFCLVRVGRTVRLVKRLFARYGTCRRCDGAQCPRQLYPARVSHAQVSESLQPVVTCLPPSSGPLS